VSDTCGALVCTDCDTHYDLRNVNKLVGCFCGWNRHKLDPYENIDGDDDIPF
jgi:predicted  nucleic acid-binding Zn-ribbon protein